MERSNADFLERIQERRERSRHWLEDYPEGDRRAYFQSSEAKKRLLRAAAATKKLDEFKG